MNRLRLYRIDDNIWAVFRGPTCVALVARDGSAPPVTWCAEDVSTGDRVVGTTRMAVARTIAGVR